MQRKVKINSSDYFYELDYVNFPPKPYTLLYFLHFCSKYIIIRKKKKNQYYFFNYQAVPRRNKNGQQLHENI